MRGIISRLSEPSTYAGIAGVLGALGLWGLSTSDWSAIVAVPMALAAAVSVFVKERGDAGPSKPRPTR